jgi:hypothetical protein
MLVVDLRDYPECRNCLFVFVSLPSRFGFFGSRLFWLGVARMRAGWYVWRDPPSSEDEPAGSLVVTGLWLFAVFFAPSY